MFIDNKKCNPDCNNCVKICSFIKKNNLIRKTSAQELKITDSQICEQCKEKPCIEMCINNAIKKKEGDSLGAV